jgi:8-oxo-dGTP pyrophosphatase MutT (NUDIX family)
LRWTVHGEREIYGSPWVRLAIADVELPDATRIDHHVVRVPTGSAAAVVHQGGEVLLLYRHRFIVDGWGWEVPGGRLDPGEQDPVTAARREVLEETGWLAGEGRLLASGYPMPGLADILHHVVLFEGAERAGEPSDPFEAERVEWVPVARARQLISAGEMPDGYSQYALLAWFAFGGGA